MNNPDVSLDPATHPSATPETRVRIIETAKKISKGWTRLEIIEWVKETYKLSQQSAEKYWNSALSYLAIKATDSEYIEQMRQKTVATLDRLVQTEIAEGRYKEANTSMELLSKLLGYNVQKVEAKVDADVRFDFGGE